MKTKAIICDLDGTLVCNPNWNGDFEQFYTILEEGYPIEWCKTLLESLAKNNIKIIFLTARDEKCREQTINQLNSWFDFDYELYMRKNKDTTIDYLMKEEFLKEILERYDVLFTIDDNPINCVMFKDYIPTLKVV